MARIQPLTYDEAAPEARDEWNRQVKAHSRMTNMKRTLARSPLALRVYMEWYPLRDEVAAFLGDRLTGLFAHAISTRNDCLICSTFFRRYFLDAGLDPDEAVLNEREQAVLAFGRQLATDANTVSDELYASLAEFLEPDQIVSLTAFGGQMIATNLFNNALRVDLDEYLESYRKQAASHES